MATAQPADAAIARSLPRNPALDGFRAIAVIAVIAYHYLSDFAARSSPLIKYYPFGTDYVGIPFLAHGYMGVELFFMISGFVIAMTLHASSSARDFAIKRFARLFPAMLLCSVLTVLALGLLPDPIWQIPPIDFIPGWTFISEHTWSWWLGRPVNLVDSVYWTLFVEVKFYILAAVAFFGARRFAPAVPLALILGMLMGAEIVVGKFIPESGLDNYKSWTMYDYLPLFVAGCAFYSLDARRRDWVSVVLVVVSLAVLLIRTKGNFEVVALTVTFFLMFVGLVYAPRSVALFAWKPLVAIGAWSYALYLLHDRIGIALTYNLGLLAPPWLQHSVLIPLATGTLLTALSMLVFRYWEKPARNLIRRATLPRATAAARN